MFLVFCVSFVEKICIGDRSLFIGFEGDFVVKFF